MSASINIEREGRRSYIVGSTYPFRDQLRAAGAHWDAERRAWWIGGKADVAEALASRLQDALPTESASPSATDRATEMLARDRAHILGRATYHEKNYYYVGSGRSDKGEWVRLLFLDGSRTFFADAAEVEIEHTYERSKTLAELRDYAARMRERVREYGCGCWCHGGSDCDCPAWCSLHHDGCERCGCET